MNKTDTVSFGKKVGLLSPLGVAEYRSLWLATGISTIGAQMQIVAAGWFMTSLTTSAFMVGLVQAASSASFLILAPFAGVMTDLFNKGKILLYTQAYLFLSTLILATLVYQEKLMAWGLLGFLSAAGVATAFYSVCWQTMVQETLPRHLLSPAVSLNSINANAARSIGPAIGGGLITLAGPAAVFLINAFSFLPLIWVALKQKPERVKKTSSGRPVWQTLKQGWKYVCVHRLLALLIWRYMLFVAASTSVLALLPFIVRFKLQLDADGLGILFSAFGVGSIIGILLSQTFQQRFGTERTSQFVMLISAVAAIVMAFSGYLWLSVIAMGLAGFGRFQVGLCYNVCVRMCVPNRVFGRVFSYYQMAIQGGSVLGGVLYGAFASAFGVIVALNIAGLTLLLCFVMALRHPLPAPRKD